MEPELRKLGVTNIALYGSVARDEASPDSDIDLVGGIGRDVSGFDLVGIQRFLEQSLAHRVDFKDEGSLKRILPRIQGDLVRVF